MRIERDADFAGREFVFLNCRGVDAESGEFGEGASRKPVAPDCGDEMGIQSELAEHCGDVAGSAAEAVTVGKAVEKELSDGCGFHESCSL